MTVIGNSRSKALPPFLGTVSRRRRVTSKRLLNMLLKNNLGSNNELRLVHFQLQICSCCTDLCRVQQLVGGSVCVRVVV